MAPRIANANIHNNGLQTRSSPKLKEKLVAASAHALTALTGPSTQAANSPQSLNPRPPKKLLNDLNGQDDKQDDRGLDYVQHEDVGEGDNNIPLPYVEVFLPDGTLARQCRASDDCVAKYGFEIKRWRMEQHLKKAHGLTVHIPLRKTGRLPKSVQESRPKPPLPRLEKVSWHKQAQARFQDKDRKFVTNMKKTNHLHQIRAAEKWDKLLPQFKTLSKDQFIEKEVSEKMAGYLAKKDERLARIQERIDEGYDKHRRVKTLPIWMNVLMAADIKEERGKDDGQKEKGDSNDTKDMQEGFQDDFEGGENAILESEVLHNAFNNDVETLGEQDVQAIETLSNFVSMSSNMFEQPKEELELKNPPRRKLPIRKCSKAYKKDRLASLQ